MPLELALAIAQPVITSCQGLYVDVTLKNNTSFPLEIPSIFDTHPALTFELETTRPGDQPRRLEINAITQQRMLSSARLDPRAAPTTLAVGQQWAGRFDLISMHLPLPPGDYQVSARYEYAPAQAYARSATCAVHVSAVAITQVRWVRDQCLMDGLSLLITTAAPAGKTFLRNQPYSRPLASWYSNPVGSEDLSEQILISTPNFNFAPSFDPAYQRYVISAAKTSVAAVFHSWGLPAGEVMRAAIPAGHTLAPWPFHRADHQLFIFLLDGRGQTVSCHRLASGKLTPVFSHPLPGRLIEARADSQSVHLLLESSGLLYQRLDLYGRLLETRRLAGSRHPLLTASMEPFSGQVRALFRERHAGRSTRLFAACLKTGAVHQLDFVSPLRHPIREIAFDCTFDDGQFHLLVSSQTGELYYLHPSGKITRIARGQGQFFPIIRAEYDGVHYAQAIYLGYDHPGRGYCFDLHRPGKHGDKRIAF